MSLRVSAYYANILFLFLQVNIETFIIYLHKKLEKNLFVWQLPAGKHLFIFISANNYSFLQEVEKKNLFCLVPTCKSRNVSYLFLQEVNKTTFLFCTYR